MPREVLVLTLAVALDLAVGEPPNAAHPVVWMGRLIQAVRKRAVTRGRLVPFVIGLLLAIVGAGAIAAIGLMLQEAFRRWPVPLAILGEAFVLKTAFSIRGLVSAGRMVRSALLVNDLTEARRLVAWHLVSRETASLNESQVVAATIESLAENTNDSIVAPLFFYAFAGLPGALSYRFLNTCDAMLGYRDAEREWLGKAPARLDDLANFLPARLTALLMIAAGMLICRSPRRSTAIWLRDCRATASPNAGHPMSAAAGVLGLELEKIGHYRLGQGQRLPQAKDIARSIWLLTLTVVLACVTFGLGLHHIRLVRS